MPQSLTPKTARYFLTSALPHIAGDYVGKHWLASFAKLKPDA
ncbi:DUF2891 family protein [Neorhizobium galegae]|nr:DUF2891 family protein [Neorhizobium galegae]KAB1126334.1 DUF2891 family protein [Neorhizobium galegae]MCQ1805305.1 DUF2891 domain-containing protein [Neorhizobium galegae]CDZ56067.1 Hypothetical protein NGAL_HAMBI2566_06170 [Neorhizobium galegae bv. orientalis]